MQKRLDERLDPINYIDDERDGYMFESGFKLLALDDKCGAVFADFNWKDGTKNFKVFESEDDVQTRETFKKDKNRNQNLDENCQISDTYAGLINIVAKSALYICQATILIIAAENKIMTAEMRNVIFLKILPKRQKIPTPIKNAEKSPI